MDLNDTAAFVAVCSAGSFTAAAERLGVPKGTVSRQVARLEGRLGARLLQRTTRKVAMTDVGRAYYERCRHAVEAIADAERLVADVTGTVTGTLRISAGFDIGRDWLVSWLPDLRERHPALSLEIELSQRRVDLIAENFDVALRAGAAMADSAYVARKLAASGLVFCAAPAYLAKRRAPRRLEDLAHHDCLSLQRPPGVPRWRLTGPDGPVDVELASWLVVNEPSMLRDAVLRGLGIGLCEAVSAGPHLANGDLVRVLPKYSLEGGGLWAVYPSTHHLSPKVRVFVDFVAAKVAKLEL